MAFPMPTGTAEGAPAGVALASEGGEAGGSRPGRGLRLALADSAGADTTAPGTTAEGEEGDDEPPPPPRPALKRVK